METDEQTIRLKTAHKLLEKKIEVQEASLANKLERLEAQRRVRLLGTGKDSDSGTGKEA